ncbi:hypothetical protein EG68_01283 [Paragonimus skrjabini miyazakii]|uniref:Serpin domain-containing protein n=1 Tax=Paragonimus skrjabini miyazakii TaxID=59628 RepID=A0A8S9ZC07_9TREM|nr:hypothetical protein EG68_01283 [Paragonimus skrjabini miyazakii]
MHCISKECGRISLTNRGHFMRISPAHIPYEELTDWSAQAVRLPFKGTDWQMLIVLPKDASGLPDVLSHLRKPNALEDLLKKPFHEIELDLFLPKFKLSQCEPVDEEGATAAAATAVMISMNCARWTPVVRVDRPFFVALTCASTVPVFIGHVTHPENN